MRPRAPSALLGAALVPWLIAALAGIAWALPVPTAYRVGRDWYLEPHTLALGIGLAAAWCWAILVLLVAFYALSSGQRRPLVFFSLAASALFAIVLPYAVQTSAA